MITFDIFGEGKNKAVTLSFDDGHIQDERLVALFNKYGLKGTFHLNSGLFGNVSSPSGRVRLAEDRIRELYVGHEIACHSTVHTTLTQLPTQEIVSDTLADRANLERICGYPVRGMSYPNGAYDERVMEALRSCGIEYSRTVVPSGGSFLPDEFLAWHPSCHYSHAMEVAKAFAANYRKGRLLYIWGHGFEMDESEEYGWEYTEELCRVLASDAENTWYATNIEIVDFVNAQRNLKITADGRTVYNPSAIDVWFRCDGRPVRIKGGETLKV